MDFYRNRFELMHGEQRVAFIDTSGSCRIDNWAFMPYDIYLEDTEEDTDIDTRINNITNFYFWCASRVLTLDRKYAKEILNSIGASQAVTDRDRAQISLSYHCLSLIDIYWVRRYGEKVTFAEMNLFENHLSNAFVDVSLRGKQMTVENRHLLADDLSTKGVFPKAWIREEDGFRLLKDGKKSAVDNELLASKICQCFRCNQVTYEEGYYDGEKVSSSRIITSLRYSLVTKEAFDIYACNHDMNALEYILRLDGYSYYMMNILDYLIGNTDRHWGNWGLLVDNRDNRPVRLYDLMDFNQAFHAYDSLEGANCLTVSERRMTQKEAAVKAVQEIGLNQIKEVRREWFRGRDTDYQMFLNRMEVLSYYS